MASSLPHLPSLVQGAAGAGNRGARLQLRDGRRRLEAPSQSPRPSSGGIVRSGSPVEGCDAVLTHGGRSRARRMRRATASNTCRRAAGKGRPVSDRRSRRDQGSAQASGSLAGSRAVCHALVQGLDKTRSTVGTTVARPRAAGRKRAMPSSVRGRWESSGQRAGSRLTGDGVTHEVQLHRPEVCLPCELAARDRLQHLTRDPAERSRARRACREVARASARRQRERHRAARARPTTACGPSSAGAGRHPPPSTPSVAASEQRHGAQLLDTGSLERILSRSRMSST